MNIIFIVNFRIYKKFAKLKHIGGIETNTYNVINELKIRGHEVWNTEQQYEEPDWVKNGNVDIIAAPTFDPLTYLKIIKFKKRFSDKAAVVIHAHTTVEDMAGNFLPDKPIFNNIFKLWLRILYGTCHLLITPSMYSKQCLETIQKIMTYPIHAVSNGIKINKFTKKEEYRLNFRKYLKKKHGVPLNAKIILNVGLSWKKKGVNIFANIAKALPDYYFVWVGPINKNPDIDEALKLRNIIFTGFYDDIREPYYGANLFLNTSLVENQGIPLIEAAICKLPIVASDFPAYDWIKHGESCYKAKKINEFIKGIEKLLSDKNFKTKISNGAFKEAVELHDFNKIGDKVEKLYQKAIRIKKILDRKRGKIKNDRF